MGNREISSVREIIRKYENRLDARKGLREFLYTKITFGGLETNILYTKLLTYFSIFFGLFFCSMPIVFIYFNINYVLYEFLLFEFTGLILMIPGIILWKEVGVYEALEKIFYLKQIIISENKHLKISIKNDIQNFGVNIEIILDIKKLISSILEGYRLISKSHKYIQGHMWYFGKIPQEGRDVINTELQWIVNYSQEFTFLVQSWISHHATELAELEKQIQSQEIATESESGKVALELSRISLQEHLKELEKVRM